MQTYLGACVELGPEDVDPTVIKRAKVTYLEGYLWDPPRAKEAFLKAAEHRAAKAGRKVALTLVRLLLRRPPPRRVPAAGREPRRHPVRQRERDLRALADPRLRRGAAGDARQVRARGADAQRQGLGDRWPATSCMCVACGAGRPRRRHDRRRRSLCRRLPLRLYVRPRLESCGRIAALAAAEIISHFGARPGRRSPNWCSACVALPYSRPLALANACSGDRQSPRSDRRIAGDAGAPLLS